MIVLNVVVLIGVFGRELYTAPFIWIPSDKCKIESEIKNDKTVYKCSDRFSVYGIEIKDKEIVHLCIKNGKEVVFNWKKS